MTTIPKTVPPLPREQNWNRELPTASAFGWLRAGWDDFKVDPSPSLYYGIAVFIISAAIVAGLFRLNIDYFLFPALSAFMVAGPALAVGLYEKSRRIAVGEPTTFSKMILAHNRCGGQILYIGVLLCLLILLWMRAAVLIYALFFGLRPFMGLDSIAITLFTTQAGWGLLLVGSLVGGLFATFSFAISVFSIPMLLDKRLDAFTAMGTSMALVWNNLPVMLTWGAIVLALFLFSLATAMIGLIVVFPLLGHATWHAYEAVRGQRSAEGGTE